MDTIRAAMAEPETQAQFLLVATLLARRERLAEFREFERQAEMIMTRYGGEVLSAVVVDLAARADTFKEIHVVAFPDRRAFDAYRADPDLGALAAFRERSILSTTLHFAPGSS